MKIIDAHVHIFPDKIAEAAVQATGRFYADAHNEELLAPEDLTNCLGTVSDLLAENKEAGISRSVVFSTATAAHQVESSIPISSALPWMTTGCCRCTTACAPSGCSLWRIPATTAMITPVLTAWRGWQSCFRR